MQTTISNDLEPRPLAEQAVKALTEQAAELAAERTATLMAEKVIDGIFLRVGIDAADAEAMTALRDDLAFLQRFNRGAKEVKSAAIKTCVGAVFAGFFAILVLGLRNYFK